MFEINRLTGKGRAALSLDVRFRQTHGPDRAAPPPAGLPNVATNVAKAARVGWYRNTLSSQLPRLEKIGVAINYVYERLS
jgi:hypothetical protein